MPTAITSLTGSYSLNGLGRLNVGGTLVGFPATTAYTAGEDLNGFKDGTISFAASTVNNGCRGDGGWAKNAPGQRSATVSLTWNKLEEDAAQVFLRKQFVKAQSNWQSEIIPLGYLSTAGTGDSAKTSGFAGGFVPTSYSERQAGGGDSDATAVECTMELASYGDVIEISGFGTGE